MQTVNPERRRNTRIPTPQQQSRPASIPVRPAGWKQAWELRPPVDGDPDYPDYKRLMPAMIEYQQALLDATDAAPDLAVLEGVDVPEVPLEEQRRLAALIAGAATTQDDERPVGAAATLPPPSNPMAVARILAEHFVREGNLTLRWWRGGWWRWHGSQWEEQEASAIRKTCYMFTEHATYDADDGPQPWAPTSSKVGNLMQALAAIVHLAETIDQPSWIEGGGGGNVVAVANGLLDLDRRVLMSHTPRFFNQTAVPFAYDVEAPQPERWFEFLEQLWPADQESKAALQEFFGYVVSGRLDQHKILLLVGPTRGGKGTIARILGKLVGPRNVAGPTLSSLSYDFGLAPLIGKPLAVISDARLGSGRDSSVVVERLLAISGEDTITVNRKYREQWTGKLPARFLIISNELPRLGDASATIANRFVVLQLQNSWLGRENHGLEAALSEELPGILNWSISGLDRLVAQDRFTQPASTDEAIIALQDLASPVAAFVREECSTGIGQEVAIEEIFGHWRTWAEDNGHRPGSRQRFGRDLRAVVPGIVVSQSREGSERIRLYRGIDLQSQVARTQPTQATARRSDDVRRDAQRASADNPGVRVPARANGGSNRIEPDLARTDTRTSATGVAEDPNVDGHLRTVAESEFEDLAVEWIDEANGHPTERRGRAPGKGVG